MIGVDLRGEDVATSPGVSALPSCRMSCGSGLVGLAERVTALGGDLCTGPRPAAGRSPPGYRVRSAGSGSARSLYVASEGS
ncbi:hypothetical protein C1I99_00080 [Micromonospora deserti]|uniref:Uncharacterized protein n=1 Tax=Micromonospora deserti TaxID=2070366 RepID=A0A2W2DCU7_9ACTN|nr:hypothetical protein C1I99_00080 [Micromonospora deserti]